MILGFAVGFISEIAAYGYNDFITSTQEVWRSFRAYAKWIQIKRKLLGSFRIS